LNLLSNAIASRNGKLQVPPQPLQLVSGQRELLTSISSLVNVWQRVAEPRAKGTVARMTFCANEFVSAVGDIRAEQVTRVHVMQYRDILENKTYARSTAKQYLDGIHRLFAIAQSEGIVQSNPATGIKLRSARDKFIELQRRRPFETNEIRLLFDALSSETEPFQWLVRLLIYHGMRSGEAAQLRGEDITTISNVHVIRVHDRYGSLKNRHSQRDIPLHPKCVEFINYAQTASKTWIFPQLTLRSDRFQSHAGYFLRKRVGLTDRALTMHSLRHTWRTVAREICMPSAVSRAIMGHSMGGDVHDEYGGRPSLRLMSEWMSKIEFDLP
jgi:integrase